MLEILTYPLFYYKSQTFHKISLKSMASLCYNTVERKVGNQNEYR